MKYDVKYEVLTFAIAEALQEIIAESEIPSFTYVSIAEKMVRTKFLEPMALVNRNAVSYAATALEASSDNGDRYCASQLRDALNGESLNDF
jgi:hypothetical protein